MAQKLFRTKQQVKQTGHGHSNLHLISKSRIDKLIYVVISILSTLLILIPVGLLASMVQAGSRWGLLSELGVILGFTLLFNLICLLVTGASREQLFIATAGYMAVLVVFVGTSLQNQNSSQAR